MQDSGFRCGVVEPSARLGRHAAYVRNCLPARVKQGLLDP